VYSIIRSLLFRLDPETAHFLSLGLVGLSGKIPPVRALMKLWFSVPRKPVEVFGLKFANPVGLAAGYDKDGTGWRGLASLGFSHIEVGTVTVRPQPGNPKPRLFRLVEDSAVINRMGFPGRGSEYVRHQLAGKRPPGIVVGVNIGKNKETPLERAAEDYIQLVEQFSNLADYLAVNVSSPNTVGLRRLQARQALENLLSEILITRQRVLAFMGLKQLPILVKISPDLTLPEIDDALEAIINSQMDGVIATNTTLSRLGISSHLAAETGGLSGAPLFALSHKLVSYIHEKTQGKLPIIGVGGINSPQTAQAMLDAGASLVQLYTGLVYSGPGLARQIVRGLRV
jgi:dihydroorotate dehydrogenase